MKTKPRVIDNRILAVMQENRDRLLTMKEIKELLHEKGWDHAYEPISRNLEKLQYHDHVVLGTNDKRFFLAEDIRKHHVLKAMASFLVGVKEMVSTETWETVYPEVRKIVEEEG